MWAILSPETGSVGSCTLGFGRLADALATRPSLLRLIMPNLVVWGESKGVKKFRSPEALLLG